jgi:hypothetical protein
MRCQPIFTSLIAVNKLAAKNKREFYPMVAPSQMYEHTLRPLKGWFHMAALDKAAKLAAAVTIVAYSGRVVHLNNSGEFEMGVTGSQVPIYLIQGTNLFAVSNPGITPSGGFMHRAIAPTGVHSGLVGIAGYELETTEFDTTPTVPYVPNQLLTAKADNTNQVTGGVISNDRAGADGAGGVVRQYVDAACGVVSDGQMINEHGVPVLKFWSVYLPAVAA